VIDARYSTARGGLQDAHPSSASRPARRFPHKIIGRLFDRKGGLRGGWHPRAAGLASRDRRTSIPLLTPATHPDRLGDSYDADVGARPRLMPLVAEVFASSRTEAAARLLSRIPANGTRSCSACNSATFEDALAAVRKASLPGAALERLSALASRRYAGAPR